MMASRLLGLASYWWILGCGASDSRRVVAGEQDGGGDASSPAGGGGGDTSAAGAGGAAGAAGGAGGSAGSAGAAGASAGSAGAAGASAGSGGSAGSPAGGAGGSGGAAAVSYCTVGRCPVGIHAMFGLTPASAVAEYRAETGGPFWDPNLAVPAGAACFCVVNEFSDIPCTSDLDCDDSTCSTAAALCVKPGQHDHGPFAYPTLEPVTAFTLAANLGTGGPGFWGDHGTVGTNCPYPHLHSDFATMGNPPNTAGEDEPDHPDPNRGECGHGGLVWIDAAGTVLTGP